MDLDLSPGGAEEPAPPFASLDPLVVTPERLDEKSLRRPDFEEGHPVLLADGQEWHFRRPRVYFEPDDGPMGFRVGLTNGDDSESIRLRNELDVLGDQPYIRDLARAELALARCVLLANYDLTTAQVRSLLRFSYPGMESPCANSVRIRDDVMTVLNGESGPKPEAGGEGS